MKSETKKTPKNSLKWGILRPFRKGENPKVKVKKQALNRHLDRIFRRLEYQIFQKPTIQLTLPLKYIRDAGYGNNVANGCLRHPKARRSDRVSIKPQSKDISKEHKKVFARRGKCKWCGSEKVVKNGKKNNQQVYKCKECNHSFFDNGKFPNMRKPKNIVAIALDMYFSGFSLRKTSEKLKKYFGVKVHWRKILEWIQKYVPEVNNYLINFEPQLSGIWHADETCLKFRPQAPLTPEQRAKKVRRKGELWWHWDVLDEETRFLIAQHLSPVRGKIDGVQFFEKTKYAPRPKEIITDGCFTYNCAINKVYYSRFKDRRVERIRIEHVSENSLIERWHGGLKDRTKPMRGLKSPDTKIPNGYAIHYNYLTKHGSLGKTPAQEAKINLPFEDGWGDLIGWSIIHQNMIFNN